MQQAAPVGRRALGKYRDVLASCQHLCHLGIDDAGMATTAATQENRIVARRQPADQRPATDLFLGNEGRRQGRIDHVDVDPGDVIGDQQRPRYGMRQVGLDLDTEGIKQGNRPACLETQADGVAAPGNGEEGNQHPADNQQGEAEETEGAERKIGFVQSACPR